MADDVQNWNLLNEAQAIIPKLSETQKLSLVRGYARINTTQPVLHRLGLVFGIEITANAYNLIPTDLGQKVIDVLKGREG